MPPPKDGSANICTRSSVHACKNVQAGLCESKYACCQTHACKLIANNGCQLGSRCSRRHSEALVESRSGETNSRWANSKRREKRLGGVTGTPPLPSEKTTLCCYYAAQSREKAQEKSAVGASALFPLTPYLWVFSSCIPLCFSHFFPSLCAVLYMPSTRVRAQLSQQCFYCVAHMEKITVTGQFSPWSYVNSFDGMSGLSPVCGSTEASEGFRCCINIQPQH